MANSSDRSTLFQNVEDMLRTIDDSPTPQEDIMNKYTSVADTVSFIFNGLVPSQGRTSPNTSENHCKNVSPYLSNSFETGNHLKYFPSDDDSYFTEFTSDINSVDEDKRRPDSSSSRQTHFSNVTPELCDTSAQQHHHSNSNYFPSRHLTYNPHRYNNYQSQKRKIFAVSENSDPPGSSSNYDRLAVSSIKRNRFDRDFRSTNSSDYSSYKKELQTSSKSKDDFRDKISAAEESEVVSSLSPEVHIDHPSTSAPVDEETVGPKTSASSLSVGGDSLKLISSKSFTKCSEHFSNPDRVSSMIDSYFNAFSKIDHLHN